MIAFDIDGTLTENWFLKENQEQFIALLKKSKKDINSRFLIEQKLLKLKCTMIPVIPIIIITGRPCWLLNCTIEWIKFHNIKVIKYEFAKKILINKERILYKTAYLNALGIKYYIEDEEELRIKLQKNCPYTNIYSPQDAINAGLALLNNDIITNGIL